MDIEYLKRFVVLGQELNFHKAAERLFISQPALTHSINVLEKELNIALLDRNTKNVRLTEAGKTFLESCNEIIAIYNKSVADITWEASKEENVLRIGYSGPALGNALSPWIIQFRKKYPEINLHIIRYRSTEITDALLNKSINLAFAFEETINKSVLENKVILSERFMLMVNKESPLAAYDSVSLSEIKDENFLLCNKESAPKYYAAVLKFLASAGIFPNMSNEVKDISEIYRLVDMNMGVSIMSVGDASFYSNYQLKFLEIKDVDESSLIHNKVMAWTGSLSPAAKKFKKIVDSSPIT